MDSQHHSRTVLIRRSCAAVIDYLVYWIIVLVYSFARHGVPEWHGNILAFFFESLPGFLIIILTWFVYFPALEAMLGYTLGKALFDLRVHRENKRDFPLAVSLRRHLLDPIDFLFLGIPAILTSVNHPKGKRIGDMWAHSVVLPEGESVPSWPATQPEPRVNDRGIIYAGFGVRLGANIVDALLMLPLAAIGLWSLMYKSIPVFFTVWLVFNLVSAAYPIVFHALYGATIGKMATGIVVRRLDFSEIKWQEAFLRSSVDLTFIAVLLIGDIVAYAYLTEDSLAAVSDWQAGILAAHLFPQVVLIVNFLFATWYWGEVLVLLLNEKRRAIHDFIAGTVVVKKTSIAQERRHSNRVGPANLEL